VWKVMRKRGLHRRTVRICSCHRRLGLGRRSAITPWISWRAFRATGFVLSEVDCSSQAQSGFRRSDQITIAYEGAQSPREYDQDGSRRIW
jgi:hypothetical protein